MGSEPIYPIQAPSDSRHNSSLLVLHRIGLWTIPDEEHASPETTADSPGRASARGRPAGAEAYPGRNCSSSWCEPAERIGAASCEAGVVAGYGRAHRPANEYDTRKLAPNAD